jgi:hypothetical protein
MSLLEDLDHKEIALLKAALLSYRDCPSCAKEYPRTHSIVTRSVLPKIRRIANKRFEALTTFDEQIRYLDSEEIV